MKTLINETHLEGILYEHSLEKKVTGENSKHPGTEYITGAINIATSDDMMNVIPVYFTYVTEKTSKGNANATYTTLENIIDGKYIAYVDAKEGETPAKFRIDSRLGLREWYTDDKLTSWKRNDNGFIHVVNQLNEDSHQRSTFKVDFLMTSTKRVDADEERKIPEKVIIKGAVFDSFRKTLLPMDFTVLNPAAMDYFENLGPSKKEPVFTKIWGEQISQVVVTEKVEESAFGEANIEQQVSSRKDFVVTGAKKEPYLWDDESSMLATDLTKMIEERETYLATLKQQAIDYAKTKNSKPKAKATAPAVKKDDYDF